MFSLGGGSVRADDWRLYCTISHKNERCVERNRARCPRSVTFAGRSLLCSFALGHHGSASLLHRWQSDQQLRVNEYLCSYRDDITAGRVCSSILNVAAHIATDPQRTLWLRYESHVDRGSGCSYGVIGHVVHYMVDSCELKQERSAHVDMSFFAGIVWTLASNWRSVGLCRVQEDDSMKQHRATPTTDR